MPYIGIFLVDFMDTKTAKKNGWTGLINKPFVSDVTNMIVFLYTICLTLLNWVKYFPQWPQLWSLCPSWTIWICVFRLLLWENDFSLELHLWFLWPSWTVLMCPLRIPQESHLKSFRPLLNSYDQGYVMMCPLKTCLWVNDFSQESHL